MDQPNPSSDQPSTGIDGLTRRLRGEAPASEPPPPARKAEETVLPGSHEWLKSHRDELQVPRPPRRKVVTTLRSYLYWLLLLALVPQLMQVLSPRNDDDEERTVSSRVVRTIREHPEIREKL